MQWVPTTRVVGPPGGSSDSQTQGEMQWLRLYMASVSLRIEVCLVSPGSHDFFNIWFSPASESGLGSQLEGRGAA